MAQGLRIRVITALAQVRSLAWELLHAAGMAKKTKKTKRSGYVSSMLQSAEGFWSGRAEHGVSCELRSDFNRVVNFGFIEKVTP